MPKIMRQAPCILSIIRKLIPCGMPQHMRMNLKRKLRRYVGSKPRWRYWRSVTNTYGDPCCRGRKARRALFRAYSLADLARPPHGAGDCPNQRAWSPINEMPILVKPFLYLIAFGQAAVLFASVFGLACWLLTICVRAVSSLADPASLVTSLLPFCYPIRRDAIEQAGTAPQVWACFRPENID